LIQAQIHIPAWRVSFEDQIPHRRDNERQHDSGQASFEVGNQASDHIMRDLLSLCGRLPSYKHGYAVFCIGSHKALHTTISTPFSFWRDEADSMLWEFFFFGPQKSP
jgi:hypothetical protein